MRRACKAAFEKLGIPNFIFLGQLARSIRSTDIGTVMDINDKFTSPGNEVPGMFRSAVEFMPILAKFYLEADERRLDKLLWFQKFETKKKDPESALFHMAIGGDGAPI